MANESTQGYQHYDRVGEDLTPYQLRKRLPVKAKHLPTIANWQPTRAKRVKDALNDIGLA